MNFTTIIDNIHSVEWELSLSEAYIFSWIKDLSGWAQRVSYEGKDYYFGSRTKCIAEMPLLTDKPDTIYRIYRDLQSKGLVLYQKIGKCDYLHITEKGKQWNKSTMSEINPSGGKESEKNSEINPKNDSEINPTYKDIINTNDNIYQDNKETPTPFINAEKINDTGAPSVQKPTKTPRGAGANFGAVKEDFEKFRLYAKKIGMTARGLDTEFENFVKKHPKEVLEVAPKLLACVMAFEVEKTEGGKRPIEPKFMPHVQTWINGRRWESYMEMEIETAQVDIMNSLLKMPYAEVGELFKKNVEGKIWERDYAVKLWNDYESKRPKQYTQYPQQ